MNVRGIFFTAVFVMGLFIASQGIAVAQEKPSFNPSSL